MGASPSHIQEFAGLDGACRVRTLMDLVKQCSYQQQLEFVEELQNFLHKDFLTRLPPHLSEKIISYLSIDDALNCLLVCKSWNGVVGGCTAYWQACALKVGLCDSFVQEKLPLYKGMKELCISALRHKKYVKSLFPQSIVIARSPSKTSNSYLYAGNGVALRYEELNAHAKVVIERMNTPHSMVQVASYTTTSFCSRVKWVQASDDYILWKQINGKWRGCSSKSPSGDLDQWDDEPVSQGFHSISFCHKCHLVAIVSEAEDDCEVWDLQVVKLIDGHSSARKMVYPIPLELIQKVGLKKRYFLGGEVVLQPEETKKDSSGFCQSHRILLQVDNCMAIHRLESVSVGKRVLVIHQLLPDAKLSKPLHILHPRNDDQMSDILDFSGARGPPAFCLSSDNKRIGVVHECYLYVWNLETYNEESCVDLIDHNLPSDMKCIALGSVYAVLASDSLGMCTVVTTRTGEILVHSFQAESTFNPHAYRSNRFNFQPPLRQEWLNGFDYFDFWPLALAFDYYAKRDNPTHDLELQAVVGVRSHQRRRPVSLSGML